MKLLFIHQNFPGQFKHLAPALAAAGHDVHALCYTGKGMNGVTTYRYKNHTARTANWRYIRYANGDEELYDETKDPNEWTNLATKPEFAAKKAELAKFLPKSDVPDPGGKPGQGAELGDEPVAKKGGTRKK